MKDKLQHTVTGAVRVPFVVLFAFVLTSAQLWSALGLRLESGGKTDVRIAPTVALYVPEGEPVSPFLEPGPFTATFMGKLVLDKRSRLSFTLEGTGKARLLIDGEVLVEEIGKPNESERLSSGEHEFVVEYESPPQGDAQLRLFWEEREFSREPVPESAFKTVGGPRWDSLRTGRLQLAQWRCTACHESPVEPAMPELTLKAPSIDGVGKRLHAAWLAKWIANPHALRPSAHMPAVVMENREQGAADIAAYLSEGVEETKREQKATPEQVTQGGHIFYQQGCIGCHTLEEKGDLDRVGLKSVDAKFRPGALAAFLREPTKHHEATRMPDFGFNEEEAQALAGFLRSLSDEPVAADPAGDIENGRRLFTSVGCLNCHERGDEKSTLTAPALVDLKDTGCSKAMYYVPDRLVPSEEFASLGRFVPAEFAQRQYHELRCNACHSRGGSEPWREQFGAEVAHLKPPAPEPSAETPAIKVGAPPLDHLGIKLHPEWRTKLFKGEVEPKVRPWLPARMPAFPARAEALSAGFSHLAGLPATSPEEEPLDPEEVRIGEAMVSVEGGLACGTCHGTGDKPALAVFEGEGPNFSQSAARLRNEYFHLWMNDPPRVWPGTIMPKYAVDGKTPLTQHYDGDAHKQFEAIYEYLRALSEK